VTGIQMAVEEFEYGLNGERGDHDGVTVKGLCLDPRLIDEAVDTLALLEPAIDLLRARIAEAREAIER
jgi:hypothetical protein